MSSGRIHRLPPPRLGLSENFSVIDQEPHTTRDELNCRTQDPITGRLVDASQRAGFKKYVSAQLGSAKVAALHPVLVDQKAVSYSAIADANITSRTIKPPSHRSVRDCAIDNVGNVYALDGNLGWAKFSSDLEFVLSVAAPVINRNAIMRAIEVDEYRNVYCAVSEGGLQEDAFIAKWVPRLDINGKIEYRQLWLIQPGFFITELHYARNLLYTTQDDVLQNRSYAVVYELLTTETPRVLRVWEIPYPARGIRSSPAGAVYTTSPPNPTRGQNPAAPLTSKSLVGDTPQTYEDAGNISIWAWYKSSRLSSLSIDENSRVTRWESIAKNGVDRSFFVPYGEVAQSKSADAPTFVEKGPLFGKPCLFFDGLDDFMRTAHNAGVVAGFANQQQSALPGYAGARFAVFAVCVPVGQATMNCLLSQKTDSTLGATDGAAFERGIIFNRDENDGLGAASFGLVSISDDGAPTAPAAVGAGTGGHPRSMRFPLKTHSVTAGQALSPAATLITWVCTGRVSPGGTSESLFRMNGCPIDRWDSRPVEHANGTYLGVSPNLNWGFMQGYVYEILVLRARNDASAEPDLFSDEGTKAYDYPDIAFDGTSDTILEKIEASLMREYGIGHLLDGGSVAGFELYKVGDGGADSTFIHPYSDATGALKKGLVPWSGAAGADPNQLATLDGILAKWEAQDAALVCTFSSKGGIGYGLELKPGAVSGQTVYSVGPKKTSSPTNDASAIQLADLGSSFFQLGSDFIMPNSRVLTDTFCRIAVDVLGNLYIPVTPDSSTNAKNLFVLASGLGTTLVAYQTDATIGNSQACFCVAVPSSMPQYPPGEIAAASRRVEFLFVGHPSTSLGGGLSNMDTFRRVLLVEAAALAQAPRNVTYLAAVGADLKSFAAPATVTTLQASAFDAAARMVMAAQVLGDVFFTDGDNYWVYHSTGAVGVEQFRAKKGKLPPRLRVFESWRNRLVGFGDPDNPFGFILSAKDDAYDFEIGRPDRVPSQAFSGEQSDFAGRLPEPINAFIPLTNDIALIGTASGIHILRGDPAADGQIDVLSKEYGIAFGRAWTQDPEGNVYAFLSTGGVIRITPSGQIERMTRDRIEKRLRGINLNTHRIVMSWDHEWDQLHVRPVPYGSGFSGAFVESWVWEQRTGGWHPDKMTTANMQATSMISLQGNELAERRLLIGSEDGYVRVQDSAALDDDGAAVGFAVTYGPIAPEGESDFEYRFTAFQVELAADQQGAVLELYIANAPESLGVRMGLERLIPGINPRIFKPIRGAYAYMRVCNPYAGQRCSVQKASLDWARSGRRKGVMQP